MVYMLTRLAGSPAPSSNDMAHYSSSLAKRLDALESDLLKVLVLALFFADALTCCRWQTRAELKSAVGDATRLTELKESLDSLRDRVETLDNTAAVGGLHGPGGGPDVDQLRPVK